MTGELGAAGRAKPAKRAAKKTTGIAKAAATKPAKTTPAKASPAKTTPAKASPAKATPAKTSPAKHARQPAKTEPGQDECGKAGQAGEHPQRAAGQGSQPGQAVRRAEPGDDGCRDRAGPPGRRSGRHRTASARGGFRPRVSKLESSPEAPLPLRRISQALAEWIGRLGEVWVEGQVAQFVRRPGVQTYFLTLRDTDANISMQVTCHRTILTEAARRRCPGDPAGPAGLLRRARHPEPAGDRDSPGGTG